MPGKKRSRDETCEVRRSQRVKRQRRECPVVVSLRNDQHEGLEVRENEKGRGVYTTHAFTRGSFVVEYKGDLISDMGECAQREFLYEERDEGCYMYYFVSSGKRFW